MRNAALARLSVSQRVSLRSLNQRLFYHDLAALPELYDEPSNRWDMDDLLKSRIDPACIEHYRKLAREKLAAVNLRRKHDEFTN
jgi:hypothetical protein